MLGVSAICGTALWLWHLARDSRQGRLIIVALWGVLLAMSMSAGEPWVLVMGGATVMMGCGFMRLGGGGEQRATGPQGGHGRRNCRARSRMQA